MAGSVISKYIKEYSIRELICAGLQITGGAGLAYYTYKNGTNEVLTFMLSGIAVGGTYNFYKTMRKNSPCIEKPRYRSSWDIANGTFTYSVSVYAFSEFFKHKDVMWVPCLALAVSGYYVTTTSINSLNRVFNQRPLLKCCELMSEPVLVGCAATYLFYFRNHTEAWLKCLHLLATATTGQKLANRGTLGCISGYHRKLLLLDIIEMLMGGCLLCISCAAVAIYRTEYKFYWPCTAAVSVMSLYGFFLAAVALVCFQRCVEIQAPVFYRMCGMIAGAIVTLSAFCGIICIGDPVMRYLLLVTAGTGCATFVRSVISLSRFVPSSIFKTYFQRVVGPMVIVYISSFAAYLGHKKGWRFSLMTMPLIAAGIFVTYNGFRRRYKSL